MKTFFAALAVFALLLTMIAVNACYIRRTADKMEAALSPSDKPLDASEALAGLETLWKEHRNTFGLSVSQDEIRTLDREIIKMRVALQAGAETEFTRARELALESIREMRQMERFSLFNLI